MSKFLLCFVCAGFLFGGCSKDDPEPTQYSPLSGTTWWAFNYSADASIQVLTISFQQDNKAIFVLVSGGATSGGITYEMEYTYKYPFVNMRTLDPRYWNISGRMIDDDTMKLEFSGITGIVTLKRKS